MEPDVRLAVCEKFGSRLSTQLPYSQYRDQILINCKNGLQEEEMARLGFLVNWLTVEEVNALSQQAVISLNCFFISQLLTADVRTEIVSKLCEIQGDMPELTCNNWRERRFVDPPACVTTDVVGADYVISEDVLKGDGKDLQMKRNRVRTLHKQLAEEDKEAFKNDKEDVGRMVINLILKQLAASTPSSPRKRRNTEITCQTLTDFGEAIQYVETGIIDAMTQEEVDKCYATFGQYMLPAQLRDAIYAKLDLDSDSSGTDDVCELTVGKQADLKFVLLSLLPEDIECLTEVDWNLGLLSDWSAAQLEKFADKYLTLNGISASSDFTSDDILDLQHFICGFTGSEIDNIPDATITQTISSLGQLKSCPPEPLQSLTNKAKKEYGSDTSLWEATKFAELGIMLGGLTADELGKIAPDKVVYWEISGIQHLSDSALAGLTEDQIFNMNMAQAIALMETKKSFLNLDQRRAVEWIINGKPEITTPTPPTTTPLITAPGKDAQEAMTTGKQTDKEVNLVDDDDEIGESGASAAFSNVLLLVLTVVVVAASQLRW
jgi:hypothetical protein